jgi:phospholipid/cholesterol/gamma-HCH transport system substrate-binding protein
MKSAAQVGMLLVVFVVLMVCGYAVLGHNLFARPLDRYYSTLNDAGGVVEGTPVLMAGVKVGTVTHIGLVTPRQARLTLDLKHGTQVPEGSRIIIAQSLIGLGQSPVTIQPPDLDRGAWVPVGGTLPGAMQGPLDAMFPNSKQSVEELSKTVVALRKLLEDQKLRDRAENLMASTQATMERFGKLADQFRVTLADNRGNINAAMSATASALQDVRRVAQRVAELVRDPRWRNHADEIMTRIERIEKHSDEVVSSFNKLLNDPGLRNPARDIAKNVAEMTTTGKSIAAHADVVVQNGAEISKRGIEISKNVQTITQQTIGLVDRAKEIENNAIDIEARFKTALDKAGGFFDHAPSTKGFKLDSELDLIRQSDPGIWRTDVTFDTDTPWGKLYAGVYDAFETNKFTIQLGRPFLAGSQLRYGVYASKPGVGVDYPITKRLSLRADAWDINSFQLSLRARYDFGSGFVGWIGAESVFHEYAPSIGIGFVR